MPVTQSITQELERTVAVPAVSQEVGQDPREDPGLFASRGGLPVKQTAGSGSGPGPAKPGRTRAQKLSRRWAWLKWAGSYLDYMPYYFSSDTDALRDKLDGCQHVWLKESKGELVRWRGVGCGERMVCPVCGSYRQQVLANEAAEAMMLAQTAVEVGGVELQSYGIKLVLTIPKTESARIDGLQLEGHRAWDREVGRLYQLAYAFVKRCFGERVGGVVSVDWAGESAPAEAHYHVNVYLFPAMIFGGRGVSLGRWIDAAKLADMRADWTTAVNKAFGLELKAANFKAMYLGSEGQLRHWLRYLYRHSLADLWRGWQGVEDGQVRYKAGKGAEVQELSGEDMQMIADRLQAIPAHFKRVRWFGVFSDGQRAKTMASLGLRAVDVADKDDGEGESWVATGETARFVRYRAEGVVLREVEHTEDGNKLGPSFLVPDAECDYRPSGVSIGKRKRWREPGPGPGP